MPTSIQSQPPLSDQTNPSASIPIPNLNPDSTQIHNSTQPKANKPPTNPIPSPQTNQLTTTTTNNIRPHLQPTHPSLPALNPLPPSTHSTLNLPSTPDTTFASSKTGLRPKMLGIRPRVGIETAWASGYAEPGLWCGRGRRLCGGGW